MIVPLILTILGLVSIGSLTGVLPAQQQVEEQDSSPVEQNKALVTAFFNDVYDNRNVSAIDNYMADNFSSAIGANKQLFKQGIDTTLNAFPDLTRALDNMIAEGDMVMTLNSWNGTFSGEGLEDMPANSNPFTAATADLFHISGGKIVEHWQIGDYSNLTQVVRTNID